MIYAVYDMSHTPAAIRADNARATIAAATAAVAGGTAEAELRDLERQAETVATAASEVNHAR